MNLKFDKSHKFPYHTEVVLDMPGVVRGIMRELIQHGHEAYIVGGAVRDAMFGATPKDFDVFTDAVGDDILGIFPDGKILGGDERQEKILTVIVGGVEVSSYRASPDRTVTGTSLETHLSTCDFKYNSLFADVAGRVYGHMAAFDDIENNTISCVGLASDRIAEDRLRALRAVRFILKYESSVHGKLLTELLDVDLSELPPERIHDELLKICQYTDAFDILDRLGMLAKLIPEVDALRIDGGQHHDEEVLQHCIDAFQHSTSITDNVILSLACFFHDIAKGPCRQFIVGEDIEDESVRFSKHNVIGSDMCRDILSRLKFSNADIDYVATLVQYHMFGFNMEHRKGVYIKLFAALEDNGAPVEDLLLLNYCDQQANRRNPREKYHEYLKRSVVWEKYNELKHGLEPFRVKDLKVSGHDVMELGIPAGKGVGMVLSSLFEAVMDGKVSNNRPELLQHMKEVVDECQS